MRKLICAALLSLATCAFALAKPAPLTTKEVSLMLRTGYSAAAVESELARRYFMETIDATAEKVLLTAGATPALIAALRNGTYAVPPEQIAAAQAELEAQVRRKAMQAEEARRLNSLYRANAAQERAVAAAMAPVAVANKIAELVKGDLVTSKNGVLSVVNDQAFEKKKLIGLFFAGNWCPGCRKFTPQLVEYYNRVAAAHPEFEIVFVSSDRSASAMEKYMRDANMPWPAVKFEKIEGKEELKKYAGSGIPCLVLLDASGKVLSDSYAGSKYLGPSKVLHDLDQLFAGRTPGAAAAPVAQR